MRRRGGALHKRYGRAGYPAKPLVFPGVKTFGELFVDYAPWNSSLGRKAAVQKIAGIKVGRYGMIGPYLTLGDGNSMAVRPSDALIAYVRDNMLPIVPDDHIYFEIVDRGDGDALVIAKYNKIIGSRWLARIDSSTIPSVE